MESFVDFTAIATSLRSACSTKAERPSVAPVPPTVDRPLPRFSCDASTELALDPGGPGAFLVRQARATLRDERIAALESWVGYDRATAADPLGVQLSRATWLAQGRLDPQRKYVAPTLESRPIALCAADLSLADRMMRRVQLDRKGRIRGARQDLADARSALLLARQRNDSAGIEAGLVWETQAELALREARGFVVESARSGSTAADLSLAEEAVLQELCQVAPSSTERERELARLVAEQRREARREKIALREASETEPEEAVPSGAELEQSSAEALAAES